MPLDSSRALAVADAVKGLCNRAATLRADTEQVLKSNSNLVVDWAPATKVFTAANATDICTSTAHGLLNGQKGRLTNSGGALPAGLLTFTDYFLVAVATNTFQLALTKGGAAVNFTTDGTGTHTFNPVPDYLVEDAAGNLNGRGFGRIEVSNALGSLTQYLNYMNNAAVTQGDHVGTMNKLADPLG